MTETEVAEFAVAIAGRVAHENFERYLWTIIVLVVVGAAASWGAAYFSKRGTIKALEASKEEILNHLKAAEDTKASVADDWARKQIQREKYEAAFQSTYDLDHWLTEYHSEAAKGVLTSPTTSPLARIHMLYTLYLPPNERVVGAYVALAEMTNRSVQADLKVAQTAKQMELCLKRMDIARSEPERSQSSTLLAQLRAQFDQRTADVLPLITDQALVVDRFREVLQSEIGVLLKLAPVLG
jgi:hypothetical protein